MRGLAVDGRLEAIAGPPAHTWSTGATPKTVSLPTTSTMVWLVATPPTVYAWAYLFAAQSGTPWAATNPVTLQARTDPPTLTRPLTIPYVETFTAVPGNYRLGSRYDGAQPWHPTSQAVINIWDHTLTSAQISRIRNWLKRRHQIM